MRLRSVIVLGVTILGLVLGACSSRLVVGSGDVVAEDRTVSDFDSIDVSGAAAVSVVVDGKRSVRIEAEDNLMEFLTVEVEGGTLVLGVEPNVSLSPTEPIEIEVHAGALDAIGISGAGSIDVDLLEAEQLFVEVSGAGEVEAAVRVDQLGVDLSGAGAITLTGQALALDLDVSGVGAFLGESLEVIDATVNLSGAGSAEVAASGTLDIDVSGVGNVIYHGDPELTIDESGIGDVEKGS